MTASPPSPEAPRTALWHLADFLAAVLYGAFAAVLAGVALVAGAVMHPLGLLLGPVVLGGMLAGYRGLGGPRRPTDGSVRTPLGLGALAGLVGVAGLVILPNMEGGRKGSNEAAAIGALRTLTTAQALFREGDKNKDTVLDYCSVLGPAKLANTLANVGLIDGVLGDGTKQGYKFKIVAADNFTWSATASPRYPGDTGDRFFFVDESGVIRFSTNKSATSLDRAIGG